MGDTPDLGPAPKRVLVDAIQVRQLIAEQFPQWADLRVTPVDAGGWDNWTFHLGPGMLLRLPAAGEYALAVEKEHYWLPRLGPQLPVPVPSPLALGRPGVGYPFVWSIYSWLDGVTATAARIADPARFAVELAGFLVALQSVDPHNGPQPGLHNWFRGGTLRTFNAMTQDSIKELADIIDPGLTGSIWAEALTADWDGVERWFHGDLAEGNILLVDGQLGAVIDFGTCGVGDPACDLAIAWTLLNAEGRRAFRDRLSVDEASWARGRGWALWKTLATCASNRHDPEAVQRFVAAKRVLDDICFPNSNG